MLFDSLLRSFSSRVGRWVFLSLVLLSAWMAMPAQSASAASLYLSPGSGSHQVGQTFSVTVLLSSTDQAANAISGSLNYPTNLLDAVDITKGSAISLWTQEPALNRGAGTALFEGVILNPGYQGSGARIATIRFRAKAAGSAVVRFSSGSILANDGKGTSILKGLGQGTYQLGPTKPTTPILTPVKLAEPVKPPEPIKVALPYVSNLRSLTHPEQDHWYPLGQASFEWDKFQGLTGASIAIDREAETVPDQTSEGVFNTQTFPKVEDGVWYYHVRLLNQVGWGGVSHRRIQVDTQKPERVLVTEVPRAEASDSTVTFALDLADQTSGIERVEYQVDQEVSQPWVDDGRHMLVLSNIAVGTHALSVRVFDRAGNVAMITVTFTVEQKVLPPPVITEYPMDAHPKDALVIRGSATPSARVSVYVRRGDGTPTVDQVDATLSGEFLYVAHERLRMGAYSVWAESSSAEGLNSAPSKSVSFIVQPIPTSRLEYYTLIGLTLVIPILVLLFWLLLILWYRMRACPVCKVPDHHVGSDLVEPMRTETRWRIQELEKLATERTLEPHEQDGLEKLRSALRSFGGG